MSWRKSKKILSQYQPNMDWQEELVFLLIEGGTDGLKQNVIVKRFENWILADQIIAELEVLEKALKVQKFVMQTKGRPATIWRATTRILKQGV